jgi:hypothetical protein
MKASGRLGRWVSAVGTWSSNRRACERTRQCVENEDRITKQCDVEVDGNDRASTKGHDVNTNASHLTDTPYILAGTTKRSGHQFLPDSVSR